MYASPTPRSQALRDWVYFIGYRQGRNDPNPAVTSRGLNIRSSRERVVEFRFEPRYLCQFVTERSVCWMVGSGDL